MKSNRGNTPFPNALIDVFMPKLRDTEWRVLCVIVRQTLGWITPEGSRKTEDWLSHRQLKVRTGRHSEAVSGAIQGLVDCGLIAVRDEDGKALYQVRERMLHRSKLYFSLGSGFLAFLAPVSETRKPKATKAAGTKEKLTKQTDLNASRKSGWRRAIESKRD